MSNDSHITIYYKTPSGSVWPTLNEATIAHRIEVAPDVYLQEYQLRAVVIAVTTIAPDESIE